MQKICGRLSKRYEPRQPYTGHYDLDRLIEKARLKAERDGRLRFVTDGKITLVSQRDAIVVGSEDWAVVKGGQWTHKDYSQGAHNATH